MPAYDAFDFGFGYDQTDITGLRRPLMHYCEARCLLKFILQLFNIDFFFVAFCNCVHIICNRRKISFIVWHLVCLSQIFSSSTTDGMHQQLSQRLLQRSLNIILSYVSSCHGNLLVMYICCHFTFCKRLYFIFLYQQHILYTCVQCVRCHCVCI